MYLMLIVAPVLIATGAALHVSWQMIAVFVLGLTMLAYPGRPLGWKPLAGAGLLLLISASGFLPQALSPNLPVHEELAALGLTESPVRSLQPWVTLEHWFGLLFACMFLLSWLRLPMNAKERYHAVRVLALVVGILPLIALLDSRFGLPLPLLPEDKFGFFPNVNQTALVCYLAVWLTFLVGLDELRLKKRWWLTSVYWCLTLIACYTLVKTSSKSGVLMTGLSACLFLGLVSWRSKHRVKVLTVALSGLVVGLWLVLASGTEVAQEIDELPARLSEDPRLAIHADTARMTLAMPILGAGLGNFSGLYPFWRENAMSSLYPILHPESDMWWFASEAGIPALLILVGLIGVIFWQNFPRPKSHPAYWQTGLWVACVVVLVHCLWDVGMHRFGPSWLWVSMLGLLVSRWYGKPEQGAPSALWNWSVRGVGVLTMLLAGLLFWNSSRAHWFPSSRDLQVALDDAVESLNEGDYSVAVDYVEQAQAYAPLDYRVHRYTALIKISTLQLDEAEKSFQRARALNPTDPWMVYEEANRWLVFDPERAASAAIEHLRREFRYEEMLHQWLAVARDRPHFRRAFIPLLRDEGVAVEPHMHRLGRNFFDEEGRPVFEKNPALQGYDDESREGLLKAHTAFSSFEQIQAYHSAHPEFEPLYWRELTQKYGQAGQFDNAVALLLRHMPEAEAISYELDVDSANLHKRLERDPNDLVAALVLLTRALEEGRDAEALDRAQALTQHKECPAEVYRYLFDNLVAQKQFNKAYHYWKTHSAKITPIQ